MRLPTFRQRFSYHCIAYSLLMTSAASCLVLSPSAVAATPAQRYAIAAGPLDNALSQFASAANVILSFSPHLLPLATVWLETCFSSAVSMPPITATVCWAMDYVSRQ